MIVRIRFPPDAVVRLDEAARRVGIVLGRKVSRAATVRAIVRLMEAKFYLETVPGIEGLFHGDPVRRGRTKGRSR